jgi:hypothetical protein
MKNLCNCSGDAQDLGDPNCGDLQISRQPNYISISNGKYYEDGDFKGYIIETEKSPENSSVMIKYKISSPNKYLNGEIMTVTVMPKQKEI